MLTDTVTDSGYLVVAVRGGKPVFSDGFTAHTDSLAEATKVADAWRGLGEQVCVFTLEQVETAPPFPPVSAQTVVHPLPDLGSGSPAGDSGGTDRGTVLGAVAPVKFSPPAGETISHLRTNSYPGPEAA